ncbi:unnamed protein product [Ascophyllum nodosum]
MYAYLMYVTTVLCVRTCQVGDVKFGNLMGKDAHGNKYYENKDYPYGQHRWVEYADIHNYDSSTVTAAWHPWLHHMSDHAPATSELPEMKPIPISVGHHTPYDNFVAPGRVDDVNRTTWRPRGAGVGNIFQKPGEPELYFKQPGHPLNPVAKAGGRFSKQKNMEIWDPADPKGDTSKKPIRELKEV